MANKWGNNGNSEILFWGALKSLQMVNTAMNEKTSLLFGRKAMTNLENILKQRHYFADSVRIVKPVVSPGVIYGCDSWTIKKTEHWRIDAFELWYWRILLRVPWTARRSNQSILKEISLVFIGRTDAEVEGPILWPPDAKNWLIRKDPDAGKDWRQKRTTEDEMVRWNHWLDGHEFEQAPGVGDGQGSLECCSPWGHKELDTTEQLNWTELNWILYSLQLWQPKMSPDIANSRGRREPKSSQTEKSSGLWFTSVARNPIFTEKGWVGSRCQEIHNNVGTVTVIYTVTKSWTQLSDQTELYPHISVTQQ